MTALLDTTVLIDLTRGTADAAQFLDQQRTLNAPLLVSVVSAMELLVGCRNQHEVLKVQKTLERFSILQLTPSISQQAFDLIARYSRGHGLVIPDALIAATALIEGLSLCTHNGRHFQMIQGLQVARPY